MLIVLQNRLDIPDIRAYPAPDYIFRQKFQGEFEEKRIWVPGYGGIIKMAIYPSLIHRFILPTVTKFTRFKIWDEYKRMKKLEKLSLPELKLYQIRKLREILTHAYETVPFYRQRFLQFGFDPKDFEDGEKALPFPPTTKDDIMSHFPEGITAQGVDRTQWKYVASSGTTRQIMGVHDFRKANINWAAGLRSYNLAGNHDISKKWMVIPPHMCTNICGIDDNGLVEKLFSKKLLSLLAKGRLGALGQHFYQCCYSRREKIYRRVTLPSFGPEGTNIPEKDLTDYIKKIETYQPHLLEALPLYLFQFAKHLTRNGFPPPNVGVITPFGGSMTSYMKEVIKKGFGCDVYDTYGCSETGFVACDCEKHEGLHLFMDLYYIEICRNGKLVSPGELGKVYITDLENRAMPWIRYEVGDVGRYFVDDHGCGRSAIRLQVEGRVEDTIANSKGELFASDQVFDFFHGLGGIDNFQLTEKSRGHFELLCVPDHGASLHKEKIAHEFKNFFDPDASVKIYAVKTIKAEDGGKFRFVKSKSFDVV